jgi:hypothetical protein
MAQDKRLPNNGTDGPISIEFSCGPGVAGTKSPAIRAAAAPFVARNLNERTDGIVSHSHGEIEEIADALRESVIEAFKSGITHFRAVIYANPETGDAPNRFLESMKPVVASLNSEIVPISEIGPRDVPLEWKGRLVAGLRELPQKTETVDIVDDHIRQARSKFGALQNLRPDKRLEILAWFKKNKVFEQRRTIERIAIQMQVSRATIYNDLKAL